MLKLRGDREKNFFEEWLPRHLIELSGELKRVDEILDDPAFLRPYREKFYEKMGRPSVAVETFLRLMYLKYSRNLGYEPLVEEVSDSIKWRKFCRIGMNKDVPHSTTLIKLVGKYGDETLKKINDILVKKLVKEKVIRGKKLRADTTVVEANIHYPTDAEILVDGIRAINGEVKKIGGAARRMVQNRLRKAKKVYFDIQNSLRLPGKKTEKKKKAVEKGIANLMHMAEETVWGARKVLSRYGKSKKALGKLKEYREIVSQVIEQTKLRLAGNKIIPNRVVSIFDPNARPIRKGKLAKPTEFGRTLLLQEAEKNIITGFQIIEGGVRDSTLVETLIKTHKRICKTEPREVALDRGFYSAKSIKQLKEANVRHISVPAVGRAASRRRNMPEWDKRLQRWRSGGEALISLLKRKFGLRRTLSRGTGAKNWIGFSILSANLWRTAWIRAG